MSTTIYKADGQSIEITHPEKVLFPADHITKHHLVDYYAQQAASMLPYLKGRLLTMQRFLDGIDKEGFYQKDIGNYFPDWIARKTVAKKYSTGSTTYVICQNSATLIYLAQQCMITPHIWLSRADKLTIPDKLVFDLDPSDGTPFALVQETALRLKKIVETYGLTAFCMTTGSRGLHVVLPLKRVHTFEQTRAWAHTIAQALVDHKPHLYTIEQLQEKRGQKLFIDTLRNSYGATSVAPYALRARPHAPVATPLAWKDVADTTLRSDKYTIFTLQDYLAEAQKAWEDFAAHGCRLPKLSV